MNRQKKSKSVISDGPPLTGKTLTSYVELLTISVLKWLKTKPTHKLLIYGALEY